MMDQLIENFPKQLKEALALGASIDLAPRPDIVHEIVIIGMGGSGIGGNFVQSLVFDECPVPVNVLKGYEVPAFADKNTLVLISSYSGNTEESLAAFKIAKQKDCFIVCISSGGKLKQIAQDFGLPFVAMPPGSSSPRACLGYSMVLQLAVLEKYGFISRGFTESFRVASDLIKFELEEIKNKAKTIATQLVSSIVVIYSSDQYEPAAVRLRQQLNENAKMLCWHHVFPEMNHNELVGWADKNPLTVIFLRNKDDLKKNIRRMDICKEIIAEKAQTCIEIYSKGQNRVERMVYSIHLFDWISWYVADLKKIDATEIRIIDYLKSELEKDNIV